MFWRHCDSVGAAPGGSTHTDTPVRFKRHQSVTLLNFSKLQIKVHLVDMVKFSYLNHWTYPRSEAERSLSFACPTASVLPAQEQHLLTSLHSSRTSVEPPDDWANTDLDCVVCFSAEPLCPVKHLPASWDWEKNRTDSITTATHQQPNRHRIPFEMHRARPGQVNLSFTETRWETCNNNDDTSLTSLLPGLSGTFNGWRFNNLQSFWREGLF